jgi:hypothetical protein
MWSISPGPQPPQSPPEPCMRVSRTRLPPGRRSAAFRHANGVGGWPKRRSQFVDRTAKGGWVDSPRGNPTVVAGYVAHLARGPSLGPGYVVPVVITTTTSSDFRSTLHRFPGPLVISVDAAGADRLATRGLLHTGVETDLPSSKDTLLTIPCPLRREVHRHPLQDLWCRPWPSPIGEGLGSSSSVHARTGVTTLQASLHVADWSVARPRFAPGLSTTHVGFATGDLGVSPDRTHTGWLLSACRLVTSSQHQPPCCHGAQSPGRTPRSPARGPPEGPVLAVVHLLPVGTSGTLEEGDNFLAAKRTGEAEKSQRQARCTVNMALIRHVVEAPGTASQHECRCRQDC